MTRQVLLCGFVAVVLMLALAGCTKEPPPVPAFIIAPMPPIPAECAGPWPAEPRLPDQDVSDIEAAKDRGALKAYARTERHLRKVCLARLNAGGQK